MFAKIILVLALTLALTKADGNELCSCDPNANKEEKKVLSVLLEKLSSDVSDDQKLLYSVYPGLLNEFSCECENEKQRQKRKITPELPEELISDHIDPDFVDREKKSIHAPDKRCPKGYERFYPNIPFGCSPRSLIKPKGEAWSFQEVEASYTNQQRNFAEKGGKGKKPGKEEEAAVKMPGFIHPETINEEGYFTQKAKQQLEELKRRNQR